MAISPINPQILASASDDLTVRIWSLDPAHEKEPCAAILAGDGHREKVLTIVRWPSPTMNFADLTSLSTSLADIYCLGVWITS